MARPLPARQLRRKSIDPEFGVCGGTLDDHEEETLRRELLLQRAADATRRRMTRFAAGRMRERADRLRNFQYRCGRAGDTVRTFNIMRAATDPFGFAHGQRVLITAGQNRGAAATIIGVSSGWLWRHQDGDRGATAFHGKTGWEVRTRYGVAPLTKNESGTPVLGPAQRRDQIRDGARVVCKGWSSGRNPPEASFCGIRTADAFCSALAAAWADKAGDIVDELVSNLQSPESDKLGLVADLAEGALKRVQPASLKAELSFIADMGEAAAVVLLLWTQDAADTDRMLLFDAAHHRTDGDERRRNACFAAELSKVGRAFMKKSWFSPRASAQRQARHSTQVSTHLRKWPKVLAALAAAGERAPRPSEQRLVRVVRDVPQSVVMSYSALEAGESICWPAPCSAYRRPPPGTESQSLHFELINPHRAVQLHGVSQYPDEREFLIPPLSCWEVTDVVAVGDLLSVRMRGLPPPDGVQGLAHSAVQDCSGAALRIQQKVEEPRFAADFDIADSQGSSMIIPVKEFATQEAEEEEEPLQQVSLIRKLLTVKRGGVTGTRVALVAPHDTEIESPFVCFIPGSGVVALDASRRAMGVFGVQHGQRYRFGAGQREGRMTTVIGVGASGRLWHHPDGRDPRPFVHLNPKHLQAAHKLVFAGWDMIPEYPSAHVKYGGVEYNANERNLEQYGVFHCQRVLHTRGELAGKEGIIIGARGEELYQCIAGYDHTVAFPSGCRSADDLELLCGVKHRGVLNTEPLPVPHDIGLALHPTAAGPRAFDLRCSACLPFGVVSGQEVKVVAGDNVGRSAVVVGAAAGQLWAVFVTPPILPPASRDRAGAAEAAADGEPPLPPESPISAASASPTSLRAKRRVLVARRRRATPDESQHRQPRSVADADDGTRRHEAVPLSKGSFELLAKAAQNVCAQAFSLSKHPRRQSSRWACAERDGSPATLREITVCNVPMLACFGEEVVYDGSYATCNVFRLYHRQKVLWRELSSPPDAELTESVVVGVWRAELWRVDAGEVVARPWAGSSAEALQQVYSVEVVGYAAEVEPPLDTLRIPGSAVLRTFRDRWYRRPGVLEYPTSGGHIVGFDTDEAAIAAVSGIKGLQHGSRLVQTRRADRPLMQTVSLPLLPGGGPRRLWSWFKEPLRCTVVGVHSGSLWVLTDKSVGAAPLDRASIHRFHRTDEPLQPLPAYQPPGARDVPRAEAGAGQEQVQEDPSEPGCDADKQDTSSEDGRQDASDDDEDVIHNYPRRAVVRTAERQVQPLLGHVTDADEDEMRYRFWNVPGAALVGVVRWILELHGVDAPVGETAGGLLRRLHVLEYHFGQPIAVPTAVDFTKSRLRRLCRLEKQNRTGIVFHWEGSVAEINDELRVVGLACERIRREQLRRRSRQLRQSLRATPTAAMMVKAARERASMMTAERLEVLDSDSDDEHRDDEHRDDEHRGDEPAKPPGTDPTTATTPTTDPSPVHLPAPGPLLSPPVQAQRTPTPGRSENDGARGSLFQPTASSATRRRRSVMQTEAELKSAGDGGRSSLTPSMLRALAPRASGQAAGDLDLDKKLRLPRAQVPDLRPPPDNEVEPLRYVLRTGAVLLLDASNKRCAPFGFYSGQRVEYTVGDLKGRKAVVVGAAHNKLWRYDEGAAAQRPGLLAFKGQTLEEIQSVHQLVVVDENVAVPRSDPFEFITHQGDITVFDPSDRACEPFGVHHGDRLQCVGDGVLHGLLVTVIGVRQKMLWYATDWSGAVPWNPADYSADFATSMGLIPMYHTTVTPWGASSPVALHDGRCFDTTAQSCRRYGVRSGQRLQSADRTRSGTVIGTRFGRLCYVLRGGSTVYCFESADTVTRCRLLLGAEPARQFVGEHLESALPNHEPGLTSEFRYLGTGQRVCLFDTREASMKPFGYRHGQRLKLNAMSAKAAHDSCMVTVIGVRDRLLWRLVDGDQHATAFIGADSGDLIKQLWNPVDLGVGKIQEMTG